MEPIASRFAASMKPPAKAGAPESSGAAKGGPHLSLATAEEWLAESIASAPPPEQVHISTHLKACLPALLERLKG